MPDLLTIERLSAGYGEAVVLHEVSLALAERQSLALLGRNGMGKTTLINSIVGVTRFIGGISASTAAISPTCARPAGACRHRLGAAGTQHLQIAHGRGKSHRRGAAGAVDPGRIYELFPRLDERRRNLGNQLSGGEQQMLAVGRALVLNPRVILLDEPLEGLAPILVEELLAALRRIIRDEGMSAILVEQNAQKVLGVTDRAAILERGTVVYEGASADLAADRQCWRAISASPPPALAAVGGGRDRGRPALTPDGICPTAATGTIRRRFLVDDALPGVPLLALDCLQEPPQ